jgi:hypothetical protein
MFISPTQFPAQAPSQRLTVRSSSNIGSGTINTGLSNFNSTANSYTLTSALKN